MVLVVRAGVAGGGAYALVDDVTERRRIDAVRTDFVANISHELKTPVGALAVLAETLVDETDPAVVTRIVDRMLEESHRASRTIDDLLELSRIELGDEQHRDEVEAAEVVRGAVDRAAGLAERRDIRIDAPTSGPSIRVVGDRRQLVSAVGNLVENAVKYSESGGHVQVSAAASDGWVEFTVVDHGVGIPARDLDRIFERFYRVDKARSRGTGGTGLGLSIVRHVATNHGGEVLVTSREGEGSTFVLRIPRDSPVSTLSPPSPSDDTTPHETRSHDTTPHDTTPHDTTPHDTTPHDTTPHDTRSHAGRPATSRGAR
jgi:two-component system sensor histidine kinase SenX3